ncbi:hypothetical protein HCU64_14390 [Methylobacterium sp. C25]|uniref:hypothetical protein n=1 Tax=Methylobacterium sp. C25 TaxID=2721622 RepID=UPI001F3637BC|nr:hypothetical protein [Methylobacterium sp. C25]MCE4224948.1 hypothetical protein [Methylobacterium sp. C25]
MSKFSRTVALATAWPLAACVPSASPVWLDRPDDPYVRVRPARYAPVTAGVKRFDVAEPKDWIEQNRRVTPKGGSGGMEGMDGMDHSRMPRMGGKHDMGGR